MVQNAGIYPWTLIEKTSPDEWDRVMAVNLKGTFLAALAALPPMKAQRSGRMIFTSSITGPRVTSPGHGHYSATKAGINGFIKSAALEFAGYGITVNGVEPGNILTEGMQAHRSAASSSRWRTPSRSAASARRATSPMPSCSSPPTRPTTSPARPSSSTAARSSPRAPISGSIRTEAAMNILDYFTFEPVGARIDELETPVPLIDIDIVDRNLKRWQERCDALGIANRPHIKTHKLAPLARYQVALGAKGITVQKLGEAEAMADAGIHDLLADLQHRRRVEAEAARRARQTGRR